MKAQTARRLRQYHRHLGLFFTPAILFFALSGALQTIGLHEQHGEGAKPAAWIQLIASLHKDQRLPHARPRPHEHAPAARAPAAHQDDADEDGPGHDAPERSAIPLKAFVLLLSIGLILSSLLGAAIALTMAATRRAAVVALALGVVLPVLLTFL